MGASGDGRRLRWTQHRAQCREAFVAAGAAAIDRFGAAASAEQIAEVAGVGRTVLYRYFRDGEDLRQAIAHHVVQDVVGSVLPKLQLRRMCTPREMLAAAVGTIVGWLDEHPNQYQFLRSRTSSLGSLADNVAPVLKLMVIVFGMPGEAAEPAAYGIAGFVEASSAWWLTSRSMPREHFTGLVCTGVLHLVEGTALDHGVVVDYDKPLPTAALAATDEHRLVTQPQIARQ